MLTFEFLLITILRNFLLLQDQTLSCFDSLRGMLLEAKQIFILIVL